MSAAAGEAAGRALPARVATAQHRQMVRRETLIGVLGNAVVALIVVWLLFGGSGPIPVLGTDGGAFGVVPGTFMFTLGMTIGLTRSVRGKVRRGRVQQLAPEATSRLARALPQPLIVRALTLAVAAWLCLVPLTIGLLAWLAPPDWSLGYVLAFNVLYFTVMCLLVVPTVVWRALCDDP